MGIRTLAIFDFDDTLSIGEDDLDIPKSLPNKRVLLIAKSLLIDTTIRLCIVTGRYSENRVELLAWVRNHGLGITNNDLKTRWNDAAPSTPQKIYNAKLLLDKHRPRKFVCYDDDPIVLKGYFNLLPKLGLTRTKWEFWWVRNFKPVRWKPGMGGTKPV